MSERVGGESRYVGILTQTLVDCEYVKKIVLMRGSDGQKTVVQIKDHGIVVGLHCSRTPSMIVNACILPLEHEDLLLVDLESGWLLALRLIDHDEDLKVVDYAAIHRPDARVDVESQGQYLSVDPTGNFIAVSSLLEKCLLSRVGTNLSTMAIPDGSSLVSDDFSQQFSVKNATILDTFFLYTDDEDEKMPSRVYFVAVNVRYNSPYNVTSLEYFEWNTQGIDSSLASTTYYLTHSFIPNLLVPVACQSGVVLFSDDTLKFIRLTDVMSGNRDIFTCSLDFEITSIFCDPCAPFDNEYASFYGASEDGSIYLFEVHNDSVKHSLFASLKKNLGTSFVLQSFDPNDGIVDVTVADSDYIRVVYGGDTVATKAMIFSTELDENDRPIFLEFESDSCDESILSPITDIHLVTHKDSRKISKIYCCSGNSPDGALCRITSGYKGSVFLEGPEFGVVTKLFSAIDSQGLQYLFMSSPWKTFAYLISDNEETNYIPVLEEMPEDCGIQIACQTIFMDCIYQTKLILQITSNEIRLLDGEGAYVAHAIQDTVVRAAYQGSLIVLVVAGESSKTPRLKFFRLAVSDSESVFSSSSDWLEDLQQDVNLQHEISFIKISDVLDSLAIFVGLYSGRVESWLYDNSSRIKGPSVLFETQEIIPSDISLVNNQGAIELIVSRRDGSYYIYSWKAWNEEPKYLSHYKLGDAPIELIESKDSSECWALNGKLTCVRSNGNDSSPVKVIIQGAKDVDAQDHGSASGLVSAVCSFSIHWRSNPDNLEHLAAIIGNKLKIISVSRNPCSVVFRIPTKKTPRRLWYVKHIAAFAVALKTSNQNSKLSFVDPVKGRVLKSDTAEFYEKDEEIHAFCEWELKLNGNEYRYLVVGSGLHRSSGRIRLLRVKRVSAIEVKVSCQYSWNTDSPVYSLEQLTNSVLLYSIGGSKNVLYAARLLASSTSPSFKIETDSFEELSSIPIGISYLNGSITKQNEPEEETFRGTVLVSTLRNSVYSVNCISSGAECMLKLDRSDPVNRTTAACLRLNDEQFLISDKSGWIVMCCDDSTATNKSVNFDTLLKFRMPSIIGRMKLDNFSLVWKEVSDKLEDEPEALPLFNLKRAVATGTGGAVYGFTLLADEELQWIKMQYQRLHEQPDRSSLMYHMWAGQPINNDNVINGDVLKMYLPKGHSPLKQLLSSFDV